MLNPPNISTLNPNTESWFRFEYLGLRIQDLGVRFWAFRTEFVRRRESEESRREAEKAKGGLGFEGLGFSTQVKPFERVAHIGVCQIIQGYLAHKKLRLPRALQ